MRYPVDNYKTESNNHAGYDFGDQTAYGFHDGKDINDNGGGNSDLGKPLYAIAKGRVVGVHKHTGSNNFGNHFFLLIEGPWGIRYVHYAHCLEVLVTEGQEVPEGMLVAKVGNSGTVYAHCHFAIKKKPSGMDDVANNKTELEDIWEDPNAFIEKYLNDSPTQPSDSKPILLPITDQTRIPQIDNMEVQAIRSTLMDLNREVESLRQAKNDLETANRQQGEMIEDLRKQNTQLRQDLADSQSNIVTYTVPVTAPQEPPKAASTDSSLLDLISGFFRNLWKK